MRTTLSVVMACWLAVGWGDEVPLERVGEVFLAITPGWQVEQHAESELTEFVVLENGEDVIRFYADGSLPRPLTSLFTKDAEEIEPEGELALGTLTWKTTLRKRAFQEGPTKLANYTFGFTGQFRGRTYYGFSRSPSEVRAAQQARSFLASVVVPLAFQTSLTPAGFEGKKFYLGFGIAGPRDPSMMQNEVKYDVQHTHQIFSTDAGGKYDSKVFTGGMSVSAAVKEAWKTVANTATEKDMYVQYSSGHGVVQGLVLGTQYSDLVPFDTIRDFALSLKAKEVIIFTMACHSGALIDSFNKKKSEWQDWRKQGRSLMVLASSRTEENSSTGPGKDPAEPGGPNGSAGSAFGHSLWKALTGSADGFVDGTTDGFIDLGEIREFSRYRTSRLARHTPVETGVYSPNLIMNRVPSARFMKQMQWGTESLSEDQIIDRIRELDEALRIEN